jgi:hypothetical protein
VLDDVLGAVLVTGAVLGVVTGAVLGVVTGAVLGVVKDGVPAVVVLGLVEVLVEGPVVPAPADGLVAVVAGSDCSATWW